MAVETSSQYGRGTQVTAAELAEESRPQKIKNLEPADVFTSSNTTFSLTHFAVRLQNAIRLRNDIPQPTFKEDLFLQRPEIIRSGKLSYERYKEMREELSGICKEINVDSASLPKFSSQFTKIVNERDILVKRKLEKGLFRLGR
jgi:hypothetical protein